jgi:hypothetical protein
MRNPQRSYLSGQPSDHAEMGERCASCPHPAAHHKLLLSLLLWRR